MFEVFACVIYAFLFPKYIYLLDFFIDVSIKSSLLLSLPRSQRPLSMTLAKLYRSCTRRSTRCQKLCPEVPFGSLT